MFLIRTSLILFVCLLTGSMAAAQGIEVAGGLTVPATQVSTDYDSSYVPPFSYVEHTGLARQSLTLERAVRAGVWGAVTWVTATHIGVEARVAYRQTPLTGAAGPYAVAIDYLARQPPDYVQRAYHWAFTQDWPDPTGELRQLAVDGVVFGAIGPMTGTHLRAGGGVTFVRVSGAFESLAVTTFQLGGHSVLFRDDARAAMSLVSRWTAAPVAVAELRHPFSRRVSLSAGARVVFPRDADTPLAVTAIESSTFTTLTPAEAERALAPVPLKLRLTSVEAIAGLRVAL